MNKPKNHAQQHFNFKFVNTETDVERLPVIVYGSHGPELAMSSSYNSFDSKKDVDDYLRAQRTLAKHYGISSKYEVYVKKFHLVKESKYQSKIDL